MWFLATVFLLLGCDLGYAGWHLRRRAEAAARWPVAEGQLERCEVVERPALDRSAPSPWGLDLEYSYRVGGRSFRSTRYAFVEISSFDEQAPQAVLETLRAQDPLRVRYDPMDPASSVLSTQPSDEVGKLALTCFVMAGVCVLVTLVVCGAA